MLHRVRRLTHEFGFFGAALYGFDRVLEKVSRGRCRLYFYRLEIQPVPVAPLLPPHRGRQFVVRVLQADDAALAQIPRRADVIQARFAQGSVGFGAFRESELVGMLWLQFDRYAEDEVRCTFVPGERTAWDYDVFVNPELRTSFLFVRLWDTAFAYLRERGYRFSACRVSAWNTASIQSHRRLGAQRFASAVYCVFGPLQLTLTNIAPFLHLSFNAHHVPTLRVG